MAGNASNWYKPSAGPLKGQSVYLSKAQRTSPTGAVLSYAAALSRLEGNDPIAVDVANRLRPAAALRRASRFAVRYEGGAEKRVAALFGRAPSPDELAHMVGALDGASMVVTSGGEDGLSISVSHPLVAIQERVIRRFNGRLIAFNNKLTVRKEAPYGTGTRMLARQVATLAAFGVVELHTYAAGMASSRVYNGYYTWPRLGFDGPLSAATMLQLPARLAGAQRVSDLMQSPEGRQWWKANGKPLNLIFDLRDGSQSRRVLDAYAREKDYAD